MNLVSPGRIGAFTAFGIELEYMLVDRETLQVRPVADRVLETAAGVATSDYEAGPVTWSNELALHVIELKGTRPTLDLVGLADAFQTAIADIQPALEANQVMLLPTGMHPFMNPSTETRLWPHESAEIYQAYHQIFNCCAHGWSNVQSVHLNLPFADDHEFKKLHAAVRILLPLLPALAASSPICESKRGDWANLRMREVRDHCRQVPFLTGDIVPEAIFDEATYRDQIFARLKSEIAPFDSVEVFDPNFLNARGAIARFDRGSIEIRVMDTQEHPRADIAICLAVIATLKALTNEVWQSTSDQMQFETKKLSRSLEQVSMTTESTPIQDPEYLRQFGLESACTAGEVWQHILTEAENHEPMLAGFRPVLNIILEQGSLSTRILGSLNESTGHVIPRDQLTNVYRRLGQCLIQGDSFRV